MGVEWGTWKDLENGTWKDLENAEWNSAGWAVGVSRL